MIRFIPVIQKFHDVSSADLSVLEFTNLPWLPERIYWIKDFIPIAKRGNHAHKTLEQVFVMLSGILTLEIFEGTKCTKFELSKFSDPLFVPSMTWRVMSNASSDALLMVLASKPYSEHDYIRDWESYLQSYKNNFSFGTA